MTRLPAVAEGGRIEPGPRHAAPSGGSLSAPFSVPDLRAIADSARELIFLPVDEAHESTLVSNQWLRAALAVLREVAR